MKQIFLIFLIKGLVTHRNYSTQVPPIQFPFSWLSHKTLLKSNEVCNLDLGILRSHLIILKCSFLPSYILSLFGEMGTVHQKYQVYEAFRTVMTISTYFMWLHYDRWALVFCMLCIFSMTMTPFHTNFIFFFIVLLSLLPDLFLLMRIECKTDKQYPSFHVYGTYELLK
jgi:hypothetical protein